MRRDSICIHRRHNHRCVRHLSGKPAVAAQYPNDFCPDYLGMAGCGNQIWAYVLFNVAAEVAGSGSDTEGSSERGSSDNSLDKEGGQAQLFKSDVAKKAQAIAQDKEDAKAQEKVDKK